MRVRSSASLLVLALCVASCGGGDDEPAAPSAPASSAPAAAPSQAPASTEPAPSQPSGPPDVQVTGLVARGLQTPWGLAFLPDGSALVGLRDDGRVVRVAADGGEPEEVGRVPDAGRGGTSEGGLLGIALHPEFESQPWVYAFYTDTSGSENRLARMRFSDDRLGEPEILVDGIDAAAYHNGGRIAFGPDDLLYVATGDGTDRASAQDPEDLNGKILRYTADGEPAPDNPGGSPVFSLGHRNIEGLAFDEQDRLWASEFGQDTWDELNQIEAGANYGWPEVEGKGGGDDYAQPFAQWKPAEMSPGGLAIVGDYAYVPALRGEQLWQVPLAGGEPRALLTGEHGRLRTVLEAPDGSLWLTTSNTDGRGEPGEADDRILRVELS